MGMGDNPVNDEPEGFRSFGEQLQAVVRAAQGSQLMEKNMEESDGGFLVHPDFATELLRRAWDGPTRKSLHSRIWDRLRRGIGHIRESVGIRLMNLAARLYGG